MHSWAEKPFTVTCVRQVHYVLDEIVMGGMVLETNISDIVSALMEMTTLERNTSSAAVKT